MAIRCSDCSKLVLLILRQQAIAAALIQKAKDKKQKELIRDFMKEYLLINAETVKFIESKPKDFLPSTTENLMAILDTVVDNPMCAACGGEMVKNQLNPCYTCSNCGEKSGKS